jgi:putative lipoic acid-binding regulatory protein
MTEERSIELLESTHQFPCPYMFKVIGRFENGFVGRVVAAVREALAHDTNPPFRVRQSAGGRHLSITLEPVVRTGHEVLAVYRRIKQTQGMLMYW